MPRVTLGDRASIEKVYPRAEFEREAAMNSDVKTEVLRGVVVLSAPADDGSFELDRANRHVGEISPSGESAFLYPSLGDAEAGFGEKRPGYGSQPTKDAEPRAPDYEAFLDRVTRTAGALPKRDPVGRGDDRLQGLRQ